jgi:hypothetical protein
MTVWRLEMVRANFLSCARHGLGFSQMIAVCATIPACQPDSHEKFHKSLAARLI